MSRFLIMFLALRYSFILFSDVTGHPYIRPVPYFVCRRELSPINPLTYLIKAKIKVDKQAIAQERKKLGRFVLATNNLDLTVDEILSYYKSQGNVERGFMFLKDKSFHVSEVYLKKESRIEALSMIMVLCLFLYSIAQWKLRSR